MILSEFTFSDIQVKYLTDDAGNVGFELVPVDLKEKANANKSAGFSVSNIRGDDFSEFRNRSYFEKD